MHATQITQFNQKLAHINGKKCVKQLDKRGACFILLSVKGFTQKPRLKERAIFWVWLVSVASKRVTLYSQSQPRLLTPEEPRHNINQNFYIRIR